MREYIVKETQKLKKFTDDYFAQGSFYFNRLLKQKEIKVNGKKVNKDIILQVGDKVVYYTTPEQEEKEIYSIIYEDENILVVDKVDGVNSEAVFNDLLQKKEVRFIHRLDRNTKGILLFAKNDATEEELKKSFQSHSLEKYYLALCFGKFPSTHQVLTAYLKKDEKNSTVYISLNEKEGVKIITEYTLIQSYNEYSLVEICLHTGKTHQIRAHMAYIGCPLLGDEKYGNHLLNKKYKATRQYLIAKKLVLHTKGILGYLNNKVFESNYNFNLPLIDELNKSE